MERVYWRICLPNWVEDFLAGSPETFSSRKERMRFVLELARKNIEHQTGGPFGAAVFEESGRLVAAGINMVTAAKCSVFHAEIVAIALAQQRLGRYDLGNGGRLFFELVASTEPCAMCFGAIPWSGISRLVCGARDEDARRIGFDEGAKLPDWQHALESRGIQVVRDVLRDASASVLDRYAKLGGTIYNPGL